jgi:predicted MFS family arabinose efflux permease
MAAIGVLLAVLTFLDRMPPALLLVLILLLGSGTVLTTPAYQSLVPDLVPRTQLPTEAALNSISINVGSGSWPGDSRVLIAHGCRWPAPVRRAGIPAASETRIRTRR